MPGVIPPNLNKWTKNTIQFGAADVFGRLLCGDTRVLPTGMYLEFTNDIDSWVKPTDFGRSGYDYFHTMSDDTDIIRVPLLLTPGYEASSDAYESNKVTLVAQSSGIDGVLGQNSVLPFTRALSTVVGGGVIAMPDADDWSEDIVITRGYVDSDESVMRPADPKEVVMLWQIIVG